MKHISTGGGDVARAPRGEETARHRGSPGRQRLVNPTDRARRKPLIAGNWKMFHGGAPPASSLRRECVKIAREVPRVEIVSLRRIRRSPLRRGVPTRAPSPSQRRTSTRRTRGLSPARFSAAMLKDAGCTWVTHRPQRAAAALRESDGMVAEKLDSALRAGLKPIVCVGETLAQREARRHASGSSAFR